ncbi:flavin reductase [Altererythrobacter soli]|uniref:Flavin reductase n=2 Tax=Croceibacterium soli TaxID=1739690 RepID=A0A6I4UTR9_9SPHN|nr:flavin reductase [Croceibacterium soli]
MARLGAAVNLVTTDGTAGRHGMIASAVCSVTDEPPTILVCVNRKSAANGKLKANGSLCLNILTKNHRPVTDQFCDRSLSIDERFGEADRWTTLATGSPGLRGAAVILDCRIDEISEVGTHSVFFCHVIDVRLGEKEDALIYFDRSYHSLASLNEMP